MLKNGNISLRQVMNKDVNLFLKWYNDPEITRYISQYRPISEAEEKEWIIKMVQNRKETDIFFVIEITTKPSTKYVIGSCGVHKINHKDGNAEISLIIGEKKYRHQGIGTKINEIILEYCFSELNLNRVYTGTFDFNIAGAKSLEKSGLKQEGRQRQAVFKNGSFHDVLLYSILKNEWEETKKPLS